MVNSQNNISNAAGVSPKPTGVLAADLLVVDELITIPAPAELAQTSGNLNDRYTQLEEMLDRLLTSKGMERGGKISITDEEFKELSSAVSGLPGKMEAGGSTADILTTVKHLRGDEVKVDFLGIAGSDDSNDKLIVEDLHKNGIALEPGATAGASSAMSFIFTHPDGKRTTSFLLMSSGVTISGFKISLAFPG